MVIQCCQSMDENSFRNILGGAATFLETMDVNNILYYMNYKENLIITVITRELYLRSKD